jgi:hypothetical protein
MSNQFDLKCPRCGADDHIDVAATVWVRLCPDGTDIFNAHSGDHEWDDDSAAVCCACDYVGTVRDFSPANATTVTIEVSGGAAHVTECPANVNVKIIDHDQKEGEP